MSKAVTTLTRGDNELKKLLVAKGEKDLYAHVTKVCSHIVRHQSHNALDKLEEVSYLMKDADGANLEKFLKTGVCKDYSAPSDEACREGTKEFLGSSKQYFPVSKAIYYHANTTFIYLERGREER